MSTNDVPGAKAHNNDELAMGCWAEHSDKSSIFVESTEGGIVVFSMFDPNTNPVTSYRTSMSIATFKQKFSWNPNADKKDIDGIKWTWHDKTPYDWTKVLGATANVPGYASADDQLSAAQRVRQHLIDKGIKAQETKTNEYDMFADRVLSSLKNKIGKAFSEIFK